jgi:large subunit ribosomal protein L31
MKIKTHPKYEKITVKCACGEEHAIGSTMKEMKVDICSACHPFFTGNEKTLDTAGRVDKFNKRFAAAKK